jgi:hypothetical protein
MNTQALLTEQQRRLYWDAVILMGLIVLVMLLVMLMLYVFFDLTPLDFDPETVPNTEQLIPPHTIGEQTGWLLMGWCVLMPFGLGALFFQLVINMMVPAERILIHQALHRLVGVAFGVVGLSIVFFIYAWGLAETLAERHRFLILMTTTWFIYYCLIASILILSGWVGYFTRRQAPRISLFTLGAGILEFALAVFTIGNRDLHPFRTLVCGFYQAFYGIILSAYLVNLLDMDRRLRLYRTPTLPPLYPDDEATQAIERDETSHAQWY